MPGVSVPPARAQQILASTVALGGPGAHPLWPLLLEEAVEAIRRATPAQTDQVLTEFRTIAKSLGDAKDMAGVQDVLLGPLARKYDLDVRCQNEVTSRRLVPTVGGFEVGHSLATNWQSGLQRASKSLAQIFHNGTDELAARSYKAVGAVIGWNDGGPPAPDLNAVLSGLAGAQDQLREFWDKGKLPADKDSLKAITDDLIAKAAGPLIEQVKKTTGAVAVAQDLAKAVSEFKWEPANPAGSINTMRTQTAAVAGLLGVLGANKEAQAVAKAGDYLQSAAQIQQCAMMLASPMGGWGAALAVSGLVSGAGGLGAFGGSGADPVATAMHAEILAAIAGLQQKMMQEFAKVNVKLTEMTDLLKQILDEVNKANMRLGQVLDLAKQADEKLDMLLLRLDQVYLNLVAELHELQNIECISKELEDDLSPAGLSGCMAFYARIAKGASGPYLFSPPVNNPAQTAQLLEGAFAIKVTVVDQKTPNDRWRAMGLLALMLKERGLTLPGKPTNEPLLSLALLNMYALYDALKPAKFMLVKDQVGLRQRIADARDAAQDHEQFLLELRQQLVANTLLDEHIDRLKEFQQGWEGLRHLTERRLIDHVAAGDGVIATPLSEVVLRNGIGDNGQTFRLLNTTDASNYPPVRMLMSHIDKPGKGHVDAEAVNVRAYIENYYTVEDKQYCRCVLKLKFRVFLYGEVVVDSTSHEGLLLFDDLGKSLANWQMLKGLVDSGDAVGLLARANAKVGGMNGSEAFVKALRDEICLQVRSGNADSNIWNVQRRRLRSTGFLDRAVSEAIRADTQDWDTSKDNLLRLKDAWVSAVVLRAVLQTGRETAFNGCDLVQAIFSGGSNYQLFNWALLLAWAQKQINLVSSGAFDSTNPAHTEQPYTTALSRAQLLQTLLPMFMATAAKAGGPFSFTSARDRVQEMVADYGV